MEKKLTVKQDFKLYLRELIKHPVTVILSYILIVFSFICFFTAKWYIGVYGFTGFDSIIFTLSAGFEGVQDGLIDSWLNGGLKPALIYSAASVLLFLVLFHLVISYRKWKIHIFRIFISTVCTAVLISVAGSSVGMGAYIINNLKRSTIFEKYYVDPKGTSVSFPTEKRNLIYIYLESMETTFTSSSDGGALPYNTIPELTALAKMNTNFSHCDGLGGAYCPGGASWTVGAMVANSAGIPLKVPSGIDANSYGTSERFLPGVTTINNILHDNGYSQALMVGSESSYGGRDTFYLQHGVDKIYDINTAEKDGIIPKGYRVWWGMEDEKLYGYAKSVITEMASADEPFAFTMLTVDTHHVGGYTCEKCGNKYEEGYENVLSCASRQLSGFIEWIKDQSFYKNTTVVVTGDHNTMDNGYISRNVDENYERHIYNCFINSCVSTNNTKNRLFSTMDMFPTTLAAMGCKIEKDSLGLGVNLFSDKKTLCELLGQERLEKELLKYSKYYEQFY